MRKDLLEDQLLFMGAIGASFSHDLNNVFAIVGELGGLVEDILAGSDSSGGISKVKLSHITHRIENQVERGRGQLRLLNRFVHSPEKVNRDLDIVNVTKDMMDLSARFARLEKVELAPMVGPGSLMTEGDLFDLEHLMFRSIELLLAASPEGSKIEIELSREGEDRCIRFSNGDAALLGANGREAASLVQRLAVALGGDGVVQVETDRPLFIALRIPARMNALKGELPSEDVQRGE